MATLTAIIGLVVAEIGTTGPQHCTSGQSVLKLDGRVYFAENKFKSSSSCEFTDPLCFDVGRRTLGIHEEISKLLKAKMLAEKKKLERQLISLHPAEVDLKAHRPYPTVVPKFANPDDPSQVCPDVESSRSSLDLMANSGTIADCSA